MAMPVLFLRAYWSQYQPCCSLKSQHPACTAVRPISGAGQADDSADTRNDSHRKRVLLVSHTISTTLYGTDEAAMLIRRYAPAVPLLYIGYVLGAALNGLGKARLVLASTAAGALLDFTVLYNTVSRPSVNISGAIIGDTAGFALVAAINAIGLGLYLGKGSTRGS